MRDDLCRADIGYDASWVQMTGYLPEDLLKGINRGGKDNNVGTGDAFGKTIDNQMGD